MLFRKTFTVILLLSILGCASQQSLMSYYPEQETQKFPEVGKVVSASIGNALVLYSNKKTWDFLEIESDVRAIPICAYSIILPKQEAPASGYDDQGNMIFSAAAFMTEPKVPPKSRYIQPGSQQSANVKLWIKRSGEIMFTLGSGHCMANNPRVLEGKYSRITKPIDSETSFSQELIYNGRVDRNLRFIYREYTKGLAREPFTQEAQYDLATSNIIGFKDVTIEVIEATNSSITYKVLSHFKDVY